MNRFRLLLLINFVFLTTTTVKAQNSQDNFFEIHGSVIGETSLKKIFLSYYSPNDKMILDSVAIINNRFILKGFISEPTQAYLYNNSQLRMTSSGSATLYLEPKKLNIILDYNNFKNIKLKGSKSQDEYCQLEKLKQIPLRVQDSIGELYDNYYDKMDNTNDSLILKDLNSKIENLDKLADKNNEKIVEIEFDYIKQNPSSFVSLNKLIYILGSTDLKYFDTINSLYQNLTKFVQNSGNGKKLNQKLTTIASNTVNNKAPFFNVIDINGTSLSLISFQNKSCVLLDFWASWCVPCREGIPELKNLYSEYNSKGFEIIGITLDKNLDSWKKLIVKENIENWKHFSFIENQKLIENLYYVQGIPQKILINKEGLIIGKWVGESIENQLELRKILSEIFSN